MNGGDARMLAPKPFFVDLCNALSYYCPKLSQGSATGSFLQVEGDLAAVGSLLLPNTDVQQKEGGIAIVCVYLYLLSSQ